MMKPWLLYQYISKLLGGLGKYTKNSLAVS